MSSTSSISSQNDDEKEAKITTRANNNLEKQYKSIFGNELARSIRVENKKLTSSTKSVNEEENKQKIDNEIEMMFQVARAAIKQLD